MDVVDLQSSNQLDLSSEVHGKEVEVTITAATAPYSAADAAAKVAVIEVANAASRITGPYLGRCQH